MPKTKKKFDWEVYDNQGEFLDILSMTRHESKEYLKKFPNYKLQEIGYSDGVNNSKFDD